MCCYRTPVEGEDLLKMGRHIAEEVACGDEVMTLPWTIDIHVDDTSVRSSEAVSTYCLLRETWAEAHTKQRLRYRKYLPCIMIHVFAEHNF